MKTLTPRVLLMLISLLFSCDYPQSAAGKAAQLIENQHIAKQSKKHGFRCSGRGGGGSDGRFTHLGLDFDTPEELTIAKARRYLVEGVIEFRNDINKHEELKDHFIEWPFPIDRLEYTIDVKVGNGAWPKFPNGPTRDNKISYVQLNYFSKKINYYIDVETNNLPKKIHSETFEEAVAILKSEGWTEPRN